MTRPAALSGEPPTYAKASAGKHPYSVLQLKRF